MLRWFRASFEIVLLALCILAVATGCGDSDPEVDAPLGAAHLASHGGTSPFITGVIPASGPAGASVMILGENMPADSVVHFSNGSMGGGQPAQVIGWNDLAITVTVPAGSNSGPITVFTAEGYGQWPMFTVDSTEIPSVSSFLPTTGGVGTMVNILGTGFTGLTSVEFGGVPAQLVALVSDTEINAIIPAGAGTGSITVTNTLGSMQVAGFTLLPAPTLTSVSPPNALPGITVVLSGTNLATTSSVTFSGDYGGPPSPVGASFTVINDSMLTAVVPTGTLSGPITVTSPGGSATIPFLVDAVMPPTVTSIPAGGFLGDLVTVTGYGFTGATSVTFGGVAADQFYLFGDDQLFVWVPPTASSGPIVVTNAMGNGTSPTNFDVYAPPRVDGFLPGNGQLGDSIVLVGQYFTGTTMVTFDAGPSEPTITGVAASFTVDDDGQITVIVPPGAVSGPIRVTNAWGSGTSPPFGVNAIAPPTISGFSPTSGVPGDLVTIDGTNFTGTNTVWFAGNPIMSYAVVSDTQIIATVPDGVEPGPISVGNDLGLAQSVQNFTPPPPPTVTGFSPTSGQPGDVITVTGTGFLAANSVRFGQGSWTTVTIIDDTTLTTTVPVGAESGPIFVSSNMGSGASPMIFTVLSSVAPTIISFDPIAGGIGDGVTITGSGFTGTTVVTFNGVAATFNIMGDDEIYAEVPGGATTGPIAITNTVGTTVSVSAFTVVPQPTISAISPGSGGPGVTVTLTGSGFTWVTNVCFGATGGDPKEPGMGGFGCGTFTIDNDGQITVTVPLGAESGPLSVTSPGGYAVSPTSFTVVASAPPIITSVDPSAESVGAGISILGSGFTGVTDVSFNGVSAWFDVASDGQILTRVPDGATTGPLAVTNALGVAEVPCLVMPPPVITSISPLSGAPGTVVTITGSGFTDATVVCFGVDEQRPSEPGPGGSDPACPAFTIDNDGQITVTVPAGVESGPVGVETPWGWASSDESFTVLSVAPPTITSFTPASTGIDKSVTLFGANFTGTTTVTFGGVSASFTLVDDTEIIAQVPVGAVTGPIAVTNSLGTAVSATNFVVIPPPTITSISPLSGVPGSTVIITGTGFTSATSVCFDAGSAEEPHQEPSGGSSSCAVFTVDSDAQITAIVPGGIGSGPIRVVTDSGTAVSADSFTVLSSAPPVITFFTPSSGGTDRLVRIYGSGFTGTTDVAFGGVSATFNVVSDGEIVTWVPQGAVSGPITVTNTLDTATSGSSFTVLPTPAITSFSPGSGGAGTTVTILGSNFTGATSVCFGVDSKEQGGPWCAVFTVDSDGQITAVVPPGAYTGPIYVGGPGGTGESPTSFVPIVTSCALAQNGSACDDGNACTGGETCMNGSCGNPTMVAICLPFEPCQDAVCNPQTGVCEYPTVPDGVPCNDGNLCNSGDTCSGGVCTAGPSVVDCGTGSECHTGACWPPTGTCNFTQLPDGTPCSAGECISGVCTPDNGGPDGGYDGGAGAGGAPSGGAGGMPATGGTGSSTGGVTSTGGTTSTGGVPSTGGAPSTGGVPSTGGAGGTTSSGGFGGTAAGGTDAGADAAAPDAGGSGRGGSSAGGSSAGGASAGGSSTAGSSAGGSAGSVLDSGLSDGGLAAGGTGGSAGGAAAGSGGAAGSAGAPSSGAGGSSMGGASAGAGASDGEPAAPDAGLQLDSQDEGSCGCRVGRRSDPAGVVALLLGAIALGRMRRRAGGSLEVVRRERTRQV